MTKPELGVKRLCASCDAHFFDLNRDPVDCPKCGAAFEFPPPLPSRPVREPKPHFSRTTPSK